MCQIVAHKQHIQLRYQLVLVQHLSLFDVLREVSSVELLVLVCIASCTRMRCSVATLLSKTKRHRVTFAKLNRARKLSFIDQAADMF
jgi:hypothetical protein